MVKGREGEGEILPSVTFLAGVESVSHIQSRCRGRCFLDQGVRCFTSRRLQANDCVLRYPGRYLAL